MSIEVIAGMQIFGLVTYIGGALLLYRLLVQQKDAQITFLKDQLEAAKAQAPDVLAAALAARVTRLQEELTRLQEDHNATQAVVAAKEDELAMAAQQVATLNARLGNVKRILEGALQKAGSPTVSGLGR